MAIPRKKIKRKQTDIELQEDFEMADELTELDQEDLDLLDEEMLAEDMFDEDFDEEEPVVEEKPKKVVKKVPTKKAVKKVEETTEEEKPQPKAKAVPKKKAVKKTVEEPVVEEEEEVKETTTSKKKSEPKYEFPENVVTIKITSPPDYDEELEFGSTTTKKKFIDLLFKELVSFERAVPNKRDLAIIYDAFEKVFKEVTDRTSFRFGGGTFNLREQAAQVFNTPIKGEMVPIFTEAAHRVVYYRYAGEPPATYRGEWDKENRIFYSEDGEEIKVP